MNFIAMTKNLQEPEKMKKLIVKLNISNIQFTKENAHSILVKVDYGV